MSLSKHSNSDGAATSRRVLLRQCTADQYGSAHCITTLPELCQLTIFDHLPLDDLLHTVGQVCTKWRSLCPSAFCRRRVLSIMVREPNSSGDTITDSYMHNIHRRYNTSIALFSDTISDHYPASDYEQTQQTALEKKLAWSALDYLTLDQNDVELMMDRFPNITTLDLMLNDLSGQMIDSICFLLQTEWSNKLKEINFWITFPDRIMNPNESINRLCAALKSKITLKELTYYFEYESMGNLRLIAYKLPLFTQLECLKMSRFPVRHIKIEYSNKLNKPKSAQSHQLYSKFDRVERNLLKGGSPPAHFLERLAYMEADFWNANDYFRLAHTFVNLKSLKLKFDILESEPLQWMTLMGRLSSLKQLLYLEIVPIQRMFDDVMKKVSGQQWPFELCFSTLDPSIPVLSSVKCFKLYLPVLAPIIIKALSLNHILPTMEYLQVKVGMWHEADEKREAMFEEPVKFRRYYKESIYGAFVPQLFDGCASLRHIVVWANFRHSDTHKETVPLYWTKKSK